MSISTHMTAIPSQARLLLLNKTDQVTPEPNPDQLHELKVTGTGEVAFPVKSECVL